MNTSSYAALMAELRKEYFESFSTKFQLLKSLYDQADWSGVELEYHKLKGTGATYGAPEISTLCGHLERICRKNKIIDKTTLDTSIELLEKIKNKYVNNVAFELEKDPNYVTICKL